MRSSYSPHAIFFLAIMALCCFSVETFAQDPVQDGRDKPIFFANEVLRSSLSKQKIADTLACSIHLNKQPSSSGGKVATTANTHERKRPNILFVFSDDHSPNAIGAYDGTLKSVNPTPNIDQLAAQGMSVSYTHLTLPTTPYV